MCRRCLRQLHLIATSCCAGEWTSVDKWLARRSVGAVAALSSGSGLLKDSPDYVVVTVCGCCVLGQGQAQDSMVSRLLSKLSSRKATWQIEKERWFPSWQGAWLNAPVWSAVSGNVPVSCLTPSPQAAAVAVKAPRAVPPELPIAARLNAHNLMDQLFSASHFIEERYVMRHAHLASPTFDPRLANGGPPRCSGDGCGRLTCVVVSWCAVRAVMVAALLLQ